MKKKYVYTIIILIITILISIIYSFYVDNYEYFKKYQGKDQLEVKKQEKADKNKIRTNQEISNYLTINTQSLASDAWGWHTSVIESQQTEEEEAASAELINNVKISQGSYIPKSDNITSTLIDAKTTSEGNILEYETELSHYIGELYPSCDIQHNTIDEKIICKNIDSSDTNPEPVINYEDYQTFMKPYLDSGGSIDDIVITDYTYYNKEEADLLILELENLINKEKENNPNISWLNMP